ncbi:MAG: tetratricopeptide repeat protein [Polyangiaceae bacterium]
MPGTRKATPRVLSSPEDALKRAMAAPSSRARARYARQGLATKASLDRTTQAMLLRQLYLAHYEDRAFAKARTVILQALELGVLVDVLHQDAARASVGLGDVDDAVLHLRTAARVGPPSRRPFHLWTLGSILFLEGRYDDAIVALTRAARWGTRDKPLYRAHLALARIAKGLTPRTKDLQETIDELARVPAGQGYGRFVLGHLAYAAGAFPAATRYLRAFVDRIAEGRGLLRVSLEAELHMAERTLGKMRGN